MTDDENAIRGVVRNWMEASRAGDTATLLDLLTDDVVFTTVGRPPFGKDAFAEASNGQQDMDIDGHADIREVAVSGDMAYARTYLTITITPTGGKPMAREGWVQTIFRKGNDGRWRLARDANLLPPPQGSDE